MNIKKATMFNISVQTFLDAKAAGDMQTSMDSNYQDGSRPVMGLKLLDDDKLQMYTK